MVHIQFDTSGFSVSIVVYYYKGKQLSESQRDPTLHFFLFDHFLFRLGFARPVPEQKKWNPCRTGTEILKTVSRRAGKFLFKIA